ncbi:MAG: hypothetical protein LBD64_05690 [Odoribacteraceae bacterium]|nr:hypothetical protein [Odoribacteraceae bacterium]
MTSYILVAANRERIGFKTGSPRDDWFKNVFSTRGAASSMPGRDAVPRVIDTRPARGLFYWSCLAGRRESVPPPAPPSSPSRGEGGEEYPSVLDGDYAIAYQFDVESLLYFYDGIFTRSALERITGINQKQLAHYASGLHKPRREQERKIKDALRALGQELLSIV